MSSFEGGAKIVALKTVEDTASGSCNIQYNMPEFIAIWTLDTVYKMLYSTMKCVLVQEDVKDSFLKRACKPKLNYRI